MVAILGIDAAWTATQPSGVALIENTGSGWRSVCAAPGYPGFVDAATGQPVDYGTKPAPSPPDIGLLLQAARRLGIDQVDLIALDIPLARSPISGRRASDAAISRRFGNKGCAAHSPGPSRPGPISDELMRQLGESGYGLQTLCPNGSSRQAIEVYPHPALLTLLGSDYRIPYKVCKSGRYWKKKSVSARIGFLLEQFRRIADALAARLGPLPFELPQAADVLTLSSLKAYEDVLDAFVCAWIGVEHLQGRTTAFGDENSAIWVPR